MRKAELPGRRALTVANILANPLRMLAPILASHTAAGGAIALSGILEEQADEVIAAYAPWCAPRRRRARSRLGAARGTNARA